MQIEICGGIMGVGKTLKKIRLSRNMTQGEIAAEITNQGTYSRI